MVIILIIGFAIIIVVGVWLKRRYLARRDRAHSGLPSAWGPNQNQHPAAYAVDDGADEKRAAVARPAQSRSTSSPSSSGPEHEAPARNFSRPGKRLSKIVGRG